MVPRSTSPFDEIERSVIYNGPEDNQPIWSMEDLGPRAKASRRNSVGSLLRAGLVNQTTDGFVLATRAAVRMAQMVGRVA